MTNASSHLFDLTGKRALITGGSRGIGVEVAKGLAEFGAEVCLLARSAEALEVACADIRRDGGKAEAIITDICDRAAVSEILEGRPAFDILINNAGVNYPTAFLDVTETEFDAIFSLNVEAAYFVAQSVARRLVKENRPGSIINMSSQMGHVGAVNRTVYCGSKHAMEGWTKAMAIELGPHNVRVNTICPTFIETPMTAGFFENETFKAEVISKIKLGRIGNMPELVGAAVYLASDASSLVTGSALKVDGGWTAE